MSAQPLAWHADPEALRQYADGTATAEVAWSVEAHLPGCAECAALLRHALTGDDVVRLEAARAQLRLSPVVRRRERLRAVPLRGVLGPPWAWVALIAASVVGLRLVARVPVLSPGDITGATGALLLAPAVPVALVAAVYALADQDESARVTPRGGWWLAQVRTAVVLALAVVLVLVGLSPAVVKTLTWALPGLALSVGALALGTWTGVERAALVLTAAWVLLVALATAPLQAAYVSGLLPLLRPDAAGSAAWGVVLLATAGLLLSRRDHLDRPEVAR